MQYYLEGVLITPDVDRRALRMLHRFGRTGYLWDYVKFRKLV